jgi:hypothetical protein
VRIDGNMVGTVTITPTGKSYARYTTAIFTVTSGQHTIMFQGASKGSNTVLIDAVESNPASALKVAVQHKRPVRVEFLAQPISNAPGSILAPVRVAVLDRSGNLWSGLTVRLTLIRVGVVDRGNYLLGRVWHEKTVNGVATFSRLEVHVPGRYVLRAVVGRQHAYSEVFEIGTGRAQGAIRTNRQPLSGRTYASHRVIALRGHARLGLPRPSRLGSH